MLIINKSPALCRGVSAIDSFHRYGVQSIYSFRRSNNFCPFGDSCRYLHPNNITGNAGFTNNNNNTQPPTGLPNQHIQGSSLNRDCFSRRAGGAGWFDLPPSLRPPPEQGYPQPPSIDWG
ncbi:zinc finger CCCH domain-containing protein 3 isoform X3 [Brassica rapa]|uniref:zinc finger CCCH domain-containing protein 3 isoform X3 n=1 Tax=Brassica campestris TaxID=3711 RepID=UPI00142D1FD2|nr:zinc finger CCCH domain-containing protein 3 isoform X3 [Brassica rapa]